MPQVPGYLKTNIIHSFLTILNYKTVCACRSSIMDIPHILISIRCLHFHNTPLVRKTQGKEVFSLHGIERGYIIMRQTTYCHVCMVAYRDGKLNSSNLDKAFILNGFSKWQDAGVAFKNTTLPGAIIIR